MIVEVLFSRSDGVSVEFIAHAQLVGLKVGLLRLTEKLFSGYEITLRRRQYNNEWKSTNVRVGHEIDCDSAGYLYSFHLLVTGSDF